MPSAQLVSRERNIARVTVEIDSREVDSHFQRMYRESAGEMRIPGFRKGKVPVNIVKQRLGAESITRHMDSLLKDVALEYACEELKLTPRAGKLDWHSAASPVEGSSASYDVSIPVLPEVQLPNVGEWEFTVPLLEVSDTMVERYRERLRQRFADMPIKEGVSADGDAVEITFTSTYSTGEEAPFSYEGMVYQLGADGNLPGWDDHLKGRSPGDQLEFDYEMPANFADARMAGKQIKVKLQVGSVHEVLLPELDEAFVADRLKMNSLQEFEEMIRANLQREAMMQHEQIKREEALGRCMRELQAEITPDMLEREVESLVEENDRILRSNGSSLLRYLEQKGQSLDDYRAGLGSAAEQRIRLFLAVHSISNRENFAVSGDDMRHYAMRLMQSEGISPEQIGELMQNRSFLNDATFEILKEKSVAWLVSQARFQVQQQTADSQ
jgi:trigger factor